MKLKTTSKCLLVLTTLSLIVQTMSAPLPVVAQVGSCTAKRCTYLPLVARPPFVLLGYRQVTLGKGSSQYLGWIQNTSTMALKDILLTVVADYGSPPFGKTITRTIPQVFFSDVPILYPEDVVYIDFWVPQESFTYATTVTVSALTWTVALPSESVPLSVTSLVTSPLLLPAYPVNVMGTLVSFTLVNPYTQSVRDVLLSLSYLDYSTQSSCIFNQCIGYGLYPVLQSGEIVNSSVQWFGTGYIPLNAIRVSAHGVLSP